MKNRFWTVLGGVVLLVLLIKGTSAFAAENKIQAYMTPEGKVVYTNAVENAPTPNPTPVAAARTVAPPTKSSDPVHSLVESIATNHGVDPALVKAIIKTESNFNRWAISSKGALGLMQLIPATGARFGVRDFFDPRQNIEGGVRYMKFLLEKFKGNLDLSLAAYNAGENLVERLGRIPPITETRDYVRKVRANYGKSSPIVAPVQTAAAKPERQQTFQMIDERGVVHFSNVAPPR